MGPLVLIVLLVAGWSLLAGGWVLTDLGSLAQVFTSGGAFILLMAALAVYLWSMRPTR